MTERWAADAAHIAKTVERLREGAIVSLPTDTLYAIAARAMDPAAVARLYQAKRRPETQPLIWLITGIGQVESVAQVSTIARQLATRFWPGPLTLVLAAKPALGQPTLAVRAPNHLVALQVIEQLGEPVASSSANRAGAAPPADAQAVIAGLGRDIDIVLDAGACQIGQPSTILDLSGEQPRILREGAIPASELISG